MIKNVCCLHVNYQLFFSEFNETWLLSTLIRKTLEYQISWQDEANSRFSQFCERA
jgi:hypothetical protein